MTKYDIPYSSVNEKSLYLKEYYKLSKERKKNKYIKSGDYTKDKIEESKKINEDVLNTYDKDNILKEDEDYIYYKDKIWSKSRDHYLVCCKYMKTFKSYGCRIGRGGNRHLFLLNSLSEI